MCAIHEYLLPLWEDCRRLLFHGNLPQSGSLNYAKIIKISEPLNRVRFMNKKFGILTPKMFLILNVSILKTTPKALLTLVDFIFIPMLLNKPIKFCC